MVQELCGIGETGLDTCKPVELTKQIEAFIFHLELAAKYQRPIVVHMVKAYEKTLSILKEYRPKNGLMIHAYSGSKEMIKDFAEIGAYFSLGGFFLRKDLKKQSALLQAIPSDRLLIETDSDEHITINEVAEKIAKLMNRSLEELRTQTSDNALSFLGKINAGS